MKIIRISAVWCPACLVMKGVWKKIDTSSYEIIDYDYDIDSEIIEIYCEYIKANYYDYQCKYSNIHRLDDIAKVIYLIRKKMKSDTNFNRFYEKYKQDLEDSDPNILKIKLDVPEEYIDVLVLVKIFKALNTINEEIAKLIGIPKSNLVFKLKNIKKGCIEINFIDRKSVV